MTNSNSIGVVQIHKSFGYYERNGKKEYIFSENYFDLKKQNITKKGKSKIIVDNVYSMIVIQHGYIKKVVMPHILSNFKTWEIFP